MRLNTLRLLLSVPLFFPVLASGADTAVPNGLFTANFDPMDACLPVEGLTRLEQSDVSYGAWPVPTRLDIDTREWNNIWGHYDTTDPMHPWPGISGSAPTLRDFGRWNYLAAHFRTGSSSTPFGNLWFPVNLPAPNIDMKFSTVCGDFSHVAADPGCIVTNVASGDNALVRWTFQYGNSSKCPLEPDTDYYVNVKYHDPRSSVECPSSSSTCPLPFVSYYTGQ